MNRTLELHAWLNAVYGRTWSSQYIDPDARRFAVTAWHEGLSDLSDAHIEAGRKAVLKRYGGWPPSLPEFRRLCLGMCTEKEALGAAMSLDYEHPIGGRLIRSVSSWDRGRLSVSGLEQRYRMNLPSVMQDAEEHAIAAALPAPVAQKLLT